MRRKLLIVDDEQHICELIKAYFKDEYDITIVYDGQAALAEFRHNTYDLIILDIMLPGQNGWDVCRAIRKEKDTPIIMLTAKGEDIDKIIGLELGADDYVTKPFNPRELLARAKAIMRRRQVVREENPQVIEYPGIMVNNFTRLARINGQDLDLTVKEFDLLWLMVNNPGLVFSREQLIQKIWGYDFLGDSRAIDSTVKRLRRKLESVAGAPYFIHTVWGVGYRFEVPKS